MSNLIVVASTNPVKIEATRRGFSQMFPGRVFEVIGVVAHSGVPNQPKSDRQTLEGATNRIADILEVWGESGFIVALEGGVEDVDGELHEFAWIVVRAKNGKVGKGKTCTFLAPPIFRTMVLDDGMEVGDISDRVFGQSNSKQAMGAIGLLTNGVIDRTELYRHAVVAALIPFAQPKLY